MSNNLLQSWTNKTGPRVPTKSITFHANDFEKIVDQHGNLVDSLTVDYYGDVVDYVPTVSPSDKYTFGCWFDSPYCLIYLTPDETRDDCNSPSVFVELGQSLADCKDDYYAIGYFTNLQVGDIVDVKPFEKITLKNHDTQQVIDEFYWDEYAVENNLDIRVHTITGNMASDRSSVTLCGFNKTTNEWTNAPSKITRTLPGSILDRVTRDEPPPGITPTTIDVYITIPLTNFIDLWAHVNSELASTGRWVTEQLLLPQNTSSLLQGLEAKTYQSSIPESSCDFSYDRLACDFNFRYGINSNTWTESGGISWIDGEVLTEGFEYTVQFDPYS